jgi:hypothetical protein
LCRTWLHRHPALALGWRRFGCHCHKRVSLIPFVVSTVAQICRQTWTKAVFAAPCSYSLRAILHHSSRLTGMGHVRESMESESYSRWTSNSPTTLTCSLVCERAWAGSKGFPSPAISHLVSSQTGRSAAAFGSRLPMKLVKKAMMHI